VRLDPLLEPVRRVAIAVVVGDLDIAETPIERHRGRLAVPDVEAQSLVAASAPLVFKAHHQRQPRTATARSLRNMDPLDLPRSLVEALQGRAAHRIRAGPGDQEDAIGRRQLVRVCRRSVAVVRPIRRLRPGDELLDQRARRGRIGRLGTNLDRSRAHAAKVAERAAPSRLGGLRCGS